MSANIPTSNTVIKHNNASDPGSDHEEVLIRGILGTKEFDRLQNISQLGGVRYVFTNATHNRAEHSKRYICQVALCAFTCKPMPILHLCMKHGWQGF